MESIEVLSILDLSTAPGRVDYQTLLDSLPAKYPYYRLEYFDVFGGGFEHLFCIVWQKGNVTILYPGYLNPIYGTKDFRDFSSPYGYSGPIANIDDDRYFEQFWEHSGNWLKENKFVAEFVRFSLDARGSTYDGQLVTSLSNIKGRIIDPEEQWRKFDHKVRKNVKTSNRKNLECKIHAGSDMTEDLVRQFHDVYISTMQRHNADPRFYFSCSGFMKYVAKNPSYCAFAFVYDEGTMISTEMVLVCNESIYSFMGGTAIESYPKRPNDLLKYELINWARSNDLEYFVLGGGHGADDGIFQYKKAFFPLDVVDWTTGRKVINAPVYEDLCRQNVIKQALTDTELVDFGEKDFFPEYRKTL